MRPVIDMTGHRRWPRRLFLFLHGAGEVIDEMTAGSLGRRTGAQLVYGLPHYAEVKTEDGRISW